MAASSKKSSEKPFASLDTKIVNFDNIIVETVPNEINELKKYKITIAFINKNPKQITILNETLDIVVINTLAEYLTTHQPITSWTDNFTAYHKQALNKVAAAKICLAFALNFTKGHHFLPYIKFNDRTDETLFFKTISDGTLFSKMPIEYQNLIQKEMIRRNLPQGMVEVIKEHKSQHSNVQFRFQTDFEAEVFAKYLKQHLKRTLKPIYNIHTNYRFAISLEEKQYEELAAIFNKEFPEINLPLYSQLAVAKTFNYQNYPQMMSHQHELPLPAQSMVAPDAKSSLPTAATAKQSSLPSNQKQVNDSVPSPLLKGSQAPVQLSKLQVSPPVVPFTAELKISKKDCDEFIRLLKDKFGRDIDNKFKPRVNFYASSPDKKNPDNVLDAFEIRIEYGNNPKFLDFMIQNKIPIIQSISGNPNYLEIPISEFQSIFNKIKTPDLSKKDEKNPFSHNWNVSAHPATNSNTLSDHTLITGFSGGCWNMMGKCSPGNNGYGQQENEKMYQDRVLNQCVPVINNLLQQDSDMLFMALQEAPVLDPQDSKSENFQNQLFNEFKAAIENGGWAIVPRTIEISPHAHFGNTTLYNPKKLNYISHLPLDLKTPEESQLFTENEWKYIGSRILAVIFKDKATNKEFIQLNIHQSFLTGKEADTPEGKEVIARLINYFESVYKKAVIIAGDFNASPQSVRTQFAASKISNEADTKASTPEKVAIPDLARVYEPCDTKGVPVNTCRFLDDEIDSKSGNKTGNKVEAWKQTDLMIPSINYLKLILERKRVKLSNKVQTPPVSSNPSTSFSKGTAAPPASSVGSNPPPSHKI